MSAGPNRILTYVVIAVGVLVVVAGVLSATRSAPEYDRGTPTGTVQAYLAAVTDGDHQDAARFLAEDTSCEVTDLDRAFVADDVRVVLREAETDGDTARVRVEMVFSSADLFGSSEYAEEHTFALTRSTGGWRITGLPWPMYDCTQED